MSHSTPEASARRERGAIDQGPPGAVCTRAPTLHNLQALRGIAIILVVLLHLASAGYLYGDGSTPLAAFSILGVSGVDLFFVISGFVMATITRGTFRKKGSLPLFLYSRAARIYPAYWVFSLALLAAHLLFPLLGDPQRWREIDIARSLLLLPQTRGPILVVGWTLVLEMYFYGVVALSLLLPERFFVGVLLAWAGFVTVANIGFSHTATALGPSAHVVLHPQTIEFISGCLLARFVQAGHRRWGASGFTLGAVLLPGLYAVYAAFRPGQLPSDWERLALFGFPSTLMVYGACGMELAGAVRLPRLLMLIGDASYTIYLSHVPVIVAASVLFIRMTGGGHAAPFAADLFRFAAVGAGAVGGYVAVEVPLHRAARRIREYWQERFCAVRPSETRLPPPALA